MFGLPLVEFLYIKFKYEENIGKTGIYIRLSSYVRNGLQSELPAPLHQRVTLLK